MKNIVRWSTASACLLAVASLYAATTNGTSLPTGTTSSQPVVIASGSTVAAATTASVASASAAVTYKELIIDPAAMAPRSLPFIAGVQTHFAYAAAADYSPERAANLVKTLGATSFRDDIYWNAFAPNWDLLGAHLPAEMVDFWNRIPTTRPLLIVNNGNDYVPGTMPPITAAGRTQFAGFAGRVAAATKAKTPIYEVWNEWNMNAVKSTLRIVGVGLSNDPRAAMYYAPLAQAASQSIRAKAPGATILAAASGDDETWDWTSEVVRLGGTKYADGLSVHLYNHCQAPQLRNATEFVDRLTRLRTRIASLPYGTKPIYVTEFGWPTGNNVCAVSQKNQADNVAQFYLWAAATPWVGGTWYYQLKDPHRNLPDIESNFGLYDNSYRGKAASCSAREAMALINYAKGMQVERPYSDMFVVKIRTSWGYQIVAWTSTASQTHYLRLGGSAAFTARPICGVTNPITNREVAISSTPVVLTVPSNSRTSIYVRL